MTTSEIATIAQPSIRQLHDNLPDYVARLDLSEIAVLNQRCRKLGEFSLVPITSFQTGDPLEEAEYNLKIPEQVRFTDHIDEYLDMIDTPHIDTPQAIGLAKNNRLLAILGFRFSVTPEPEPEQTHRAFDIVQIQSATKVRKPASRAFFTTKTEYDQALSEYYKTGLHDGIDWKATLVKSCEAVGRMAAVSHVTVQSHENSAWPVVRNRGQGSYDEVAERLGYTQLPNNNWQKQII